ncbi:hypothetical protein C499_06085 [Halogeometricum borinquense DSM 11551]|uniref:Uncharacterized protein n=1 Tax=Halogeometricum borinquense (strain ATCC 700274 / DSM 11551 / JCM 10706 / KCTC 4070 / PR3) TaxID=469382 RepID=E4NVA6_HALBP|nr:hypothetical protein [Halogeometricum borinquense]ADQ69095.1 hypothetical protein Hbor_35750 [Halogeometricum borinquense DSM 11551]ELY29404.1 hypothetical protein C499_06085 [Halogeometricum borinquense DSM 11551]
MVSSVFVATPVASAEDDDHGVNESKLQEQAINPELRPFLWKDGAGQYPSYKRQEVAGFSGYLERKSADRLTTLRYNFNESVFSDEYDTYLVIARVAWHANGNGDQERAVTNQGQQDIPGSSANEDWGTVRLPLAPDDDPFVKLSAEYETGYLSSGTAVVRVQRITVIPARLVGRLSNEEVLEITSQSGDADTTRTVTNTEPATTPSPSVQSTSIPSPTPTAVPPTAQPIVSPTPITPDVTTDSKLYDDRGLFLPNDELLQAGLNAWVLSVLGFVVSIIGVGYSMWRD